VTRPSAKATAARIRRSALTTIASGATAVIAALASAQDAPSPSAAFAPCAVCHSIDGTNKTGPTLRGIVGRTSGTFAGFRYSRAMRTAGLVWDAGSLDRYLGDPQGIVPGNVMPFSGVADPAERAKIISYLMSLR
jgi:cytochrome c